MTLVEPAEEGVWKVIPSHWNSVQTRRVKDLKLVPVPSLEDEFYHLWLRGGGPRLDRQVPLKSLVRGVTTRHVVDFALLACKLVIEVNGGTVCSKRKMGGGYYVKVSGHNSPEGIRKDYAKQSVLALSGYSVVELDTDQAKDPDVVDLVIGAAVGASVDWSPLFG